MRRIPLLEPRDLVLFGLGSATTATGLAAFELGVLAPTVSGGVVMGEVRADSKLSLCSSDVTVMVVVS